MNRLLPLAAFFLSGASSLVFQLIWSRMLQHVFGSTSIAVSSVLSVFMGGLALGAWLCGRYADAIAAPLRLYALAELAIACCGLLVPELVHPGGFLADVNALLLRQFGADATLLVFARFVCVVPILIVPTTLMGATLPLLARHFVGPAEQRNAVSRRVGTLYAVNTFGALAGVFVAGFLLLPHVGMHRTNLVAVLANALLGMSIIVLSRCRGTHSTDEGLRSPAQPPPRPRAWPRSRSEQPSLPAPVIRAAGVVFAVSGFVSLLYEVVWTRALLSTIGSSVYAFSVILLAFLAGIAGGGALASALGGPSAHLPLRVALVAGVLSLIANGPLLVHEGASAAALATAFCWGVVVWTASLATKRAGAPVDPDVRELRSGTVPQLGPLTIPLAAALLNMWVTPSPIGGMAASVVACGALLVGLLVTLRKRPLALVAAVQFFVAAATLTSDIWADEISVAFAASVVPFYDTLADNVGLVMSTMLMTALLLVLPAALGAGAMFPLTMRLCGRGGTHVGHDVGALYTANTVGAILGAWLAGFVFMPQLGMQATLHLGIGFNLLAGLMLVLSGSASAGPNEKQRPPHRFATNAIAIVVPAALAALYLASVQPNSPLHWNVARMTLGVFRLSLARDALDEEAWAQPQILYYKDGLSTTVTVERWGRHYALKNNGKVEASNGDDMTTQIMVAALPLLLHPSSGNNLDAAMIGYGSGVTAGAALQFPLRHLEVIELERATVEAGIHFSHVSHMRYAFDHFPYVEVPRLTLINDDARNYLAAADRRYDVIISEPSNPWLSGVANLFTEDHFRASKIRLKPAGIYCQWIQLYELSPYNVKSLYRTFASQFEHVLAFVSEAGSSDTILLGSDAPLHLDLKRLSKAMESPAVSAELDRAGVSSPFDLLARVLFADRAEVMSYTRIEERLSQGEWSRRDAGYNSEPCPTRTCRRRPAPLNTDDNARIEFAAPRDLIAFQRHRGYLSTFYDSAWPYGRALERLRGFGEGEQAAVSYARFAEALMANGRRVEAARVLDRASRLAAVPEVAGVLELLSLLVSDEEEPALELLPPTLAGSHDTRDARRVSQAFHRASNALQTRGAQAALEAIHSLPRPLRLHGGPQLRFLYGYALYNAAVEQRGRFRDAIDELEELLRADDDFSATHPELHYFLARAYDGDGDPERAVRNMRVYLRSRAPLAKRGAAGSLDAP
ncbi:MAG: fused MFS/spermidine synthase [Proteobacteria bacterium]|nr:fused MFS/spermidine synthase [Pseudomonadota bacterium]